MNASRRIHVNEVLPFVPHRPPMVWVDEILTFSATSGECLVELKDTGLFLGPEGLRPTSCLEFIAQAFGFCSVAHDRQTAPEAPPLSKAYLAAFSQVTFAPREQFKNLRPGDQVHLRFWDLRKIGPIRAFRGEAAFNGQTLCAGVLKVFCQ